MKRLSLVSLCLLGPIAAFLVGCDESVKTTVLDGLQSGATTIAGSLISAMFQTLMNDSSTTTAIIF